MGFAYGGSASSGSLSPSCLGAAARLLDDTTEFARQRIVTAAHHRVRSHGDDAGRQPDRAVCGPILVYETARNIDAATDLQVQHTQCSMDKLYASEMADGVADRCVQIFGGTVTCGRTWPRVLPRTPGRARLGGRRRGAALDHCQPDGQAGTAHLRLIGGARIRALHPVVTAAPTLRTGRPRSPRAIMVTNW